MIDRIRFAQALADLDAAHKDALEQELEVRRLQRLLINEEYREPLQLATERLKHAERELEMTIKRFTSLFSLVTENPENL